MTRPTHSHDFHRGIVPEDQLAAGTPTPGFIPIASGTGEAAWGPTQGGLTDLLSGDDATFAESLGAWVLDEGGSSSYSRDDAYTISGQDASLKLVTTGVTGQYVEVPVAGVFLAGRTYWAVIWVSIEETSGSHEFRARLGAQGTDVGEQTLALSGHAAPSPHSDGGFLAVGLSWTPTADRTGVTLRFEQTAALATTWHLGAARVVEASVVPLFRLSDGRVYLPFVPTGDARLTAYAEGGGLDLVAGFGGVSLDTAGGKAGINPYLLDELVALVAIWAEHTPGSLADAGFQISVGDDYLARYLSEKDSATTESYGDADIDHEFRDRGTGRHRIVDAAGTLAKSLIAMNERTAEGTATIASGTTSISVTHGAGYTPSANDIVVTPTNNPTNDPGWYWVSSVGATTFDINVRADPGAGGATFAWRVDR